MNRRNFLMALAGAICAPAVKSLPIDVPANPSEDWMPYLFWANTPAAGKLVLPADFRLLSLAIEVESSTPLAEMERLCNEAWIELRLNRKLYFEGLFSMCYGRIGIEPSMVARAGSQIDFWSNMPGPIFIMNGMLRVGPPRASETHNRR